MKIFKMIRGFFLKRSRSYKIMQNVISHVKLLSPTLNTLKLARIRHLITAGVFSLTGLSIEITIYNNYRNIIEAKEP